MQILKNNLKKIIVISIGIALIIIAYLIFGGQPNYGPGTIALNSMHGSGESGYAKITEINGQAIVDIFLNGTKSDTPSRPAAFYKGSCKNLGSEKYTMTPVDGGSSETLLGGTLDRLRAELPYALVIQASSNDLSSVVACGDIKI